MELDQSISEGSHYEEDGVPYFKKSQQQTCN